MSFMYSSAARFFFLEKSHSSMGMLLNIFDYGSPVTSAHRSGICITKEETS